MATSLKLANTIAWAAPFLKYRPLTAGQNNEPALSSANTILQTMLSSPFAWPWNRKIATFTTEANKTDYTVSVEDFGSIELATCGGYELEVSNTLAASNEPSRPRFISPILDDDQGNITFRLTPCPDKAYPVEVTFQKAAPLMTSPLSLWSPIPDYLSYVYQWGFLSLMAIYADDARAPMFSGKFVSTLLAASEGLEESEKQIFIDQWMGTTSQIQASGLRVQQGAEARGNL